MKILLIEDDDKLRKSIVQMLNIEGFETAECADGEEGLYFIENNTCDVVVLDRMLPQMDGLTVLQKARKAGINTPILMLTAMNAVGDRVDGLEAGADDYLIKPFDMRELLARVRALMRRPAEIESSEVITYGDITYSSAGFVLTGPKGTTHLSKRLALLLELFLRNTTPTLSRRTIFNRVWGLGADVYEGIIDTYISLLRRRFKLIGSTVQIRTNRGAGYSITQD